MPFRYFSDAEFRRATPACSLSDMDASFLERLDYARSLLGMPIVINSAFRSVEYEHSKGRSGSSSHCKGLAADLRCFSDEYRLKLICSLLRAGFRRLGIAETFIHVDCDYSKTKCCWLYENK